MYPREQAAPRQAVRHRLAATRSGSPLNICAWVESGDQSGKSAAAGGAFPSAIRATPGVPDRPEGSRAGPARAHRTGGRAVQDGAR